MLRGESSFIPDEDSLRLKPDPMTGEFRMPMPDDEDPVAPPREAPPGGSDPSGSDHDDTRDGGDDIGTKRD